LRMNLIVEPIASARTTAAKLTTTMRKDRMALP
jgi:hypothetical protein